MNKIVSLLALATVWCACLPAQADTAFPPDAAPPAQQVVHIPIGFGGPYLDGSQTLYNATGGTELIQEPLVVYDPNTATVKPAAATNWSISPDRRIWTFHIRKGLVWSDGTPLTAHDYAFMFRRQANPTTGYDFPYFPQTVMALKNWTKINAGKLPPSALGVSAPNPYTLKITSAMPRPYLPSAMVYSWPEPQQMVHKYGNKWCTKLATMVFSGPYKPIQWVKNQHLLLVPNPAYRGVRHHFLQKIYFELGATNDLASYQAGTLDYVQLNAGQLAFAEHTVPEQIVHVSTFSVNYLTYNTYTRPFNDLRVRRAFNLAIDRLTLARDVLKNVARPVYTLLMPGFPGYDPTIKVPYDVATARRLLAQAGYPNGKSFPAVTIYLRNQAGVVEIEKPAAEYIQAQLKQNLGISLGVKVIDLKVFVDAINKHTQSLFLVPYNFDYVDPSDFMDLFVTGGRHAWSNKRYDRTVLTADSSFDPAARKALYERAEGILADQVPASFLYVDVLNALWKPRWRHMPTHEWLTQDYLLQMYVAK